MPAKVTKQKKPQAKTPAKSNAKYEVFREQQAAISKARSLSGRDIAPMPAVANAARRTRCEENLEQFCRAYLPMKFGLPWSEDHRKAIEKIQRAAREGGLFAWAMPRGGGKSSLVVAAYLWAMLYGHQEFVFVVGSDEEHAAKLLQAGKSELENNPLLLEDFPAVCYPVRRMEGIAQRANGQLFEGKRTNLGWKEKELIFPSIPGSKCSGAIIQVSGITGGFRGAAHTRTDGRTVRPSLCIIDDPQTDESAKSPTQVADRENIINGAVLGLAGPGVNVAAVMPCTVIAPDDLSDRLLDREKNPAWQGERAQMIYGWPNREDLWEQYKKIREDALRAGAGTGEANAFYRDNREAMDDGAVAAWPVRKNHHEESAIQHAMNLCFKLGRLAFFAEYQNDPKPADSGSGEALTADQITAKASGELRGIVPLESTRLVAFIDVQKELLFYAVLAVTDGFTGHVVDYGTYPDQRREHFTKYDARQTLMMAEGVKRFEEALYKGSETLTGLLLNREWQREGGTPQKIERCLIDSHWGESTDILRGFCRKSPHAALLTPSFGQYVGAASQPITERRRKPGDRFGTNWVMPAPAAGLVRHVSFDSNYWKTFLQSRLAQAKGGEGCFTLFGEPEDHRLLASHLRAEYPVVTEGRGRVVVEWKVRPHRPDNDLLDCLAGCCVAASISGAALKELARAPARRPVARARKKVTYLE